MKIEMIDDLEFRTVVSHPESGQVIKVEVSKNNPSTEIQDELKKDNVKGLCYHKGMESRPYMKFNVYKVS